MVPAGGACLRAATVLFLVLSVLPGALRAQVAISAIRPSVTAPAPVGATVVFTTSAVNAQPPGAGGNVQVEARRRRMPGSDPDSRNLRYRYRVSLNGGAYSTIVDYGPSNSFTWTPAEVEGNYQIEASVVDRLTGSVATSAVPFTITPLASGSGPVVSATNHPLVALYSAPPCAAGVMRVRFKMESEAYWHSTSPKPCNGVTTMNFYVAGMYASSTYTLVSDVMDQSQTTTSASLTFTTGAASPNVPAMGTAIPMDLPSSMAQSTLLLEPILTNVCAVDPNSQVLWYLPGNYIYGTRPVPGGTFLTVYGGTRNLPVSGFTEYDLAGNIVKQTNVEQINAQLKNLGLSWTVNTFHHDVRRLPNGDYLALAQTEVLSNAQGPNTDIIGDVILLLDPNLQVLWTWNAFEHLDVTRQAVLGEVEPTYAIGFVGFLAPMANDWTHGNSVAVTPDGNLLYSSRHQDFVYKLAFQHGTGDGHVIWKLGKGGDFTWISSDPYPWQSHQHDADFPTPALLTLYDNGNTRIQSLGGNSRGMALIIDEINLTVTPVLVADMGVYSGALGAAQQLINGNYWFDSGDFGVSAKSDEVNADGSSVFEISVHNPVYRSFRLTNLYSASW